MLAEYLASTCAPFSMQSKRDRRDNMNKALVVVESPAKAKTINKFLGKEYIVKACMGNVRDLPERELGIDIANDFRPKYVTIKGRGKLLKELRTVAEKSDRVLLATDPDREGEAIAWHVKHELRKANDNTSRIVFHEITRNAIRDAVRHPLGIDPKKVNAQQARRILDRLVGYKVSPFLWRTVYAGLSAGRVQSVALRVICERDQEIAAFKPEEYWSITATLKGTDTLPFQARLVKRKSRNIKIRNEAEAREIVDGLEGATFRIQDVKRREQRKNPAPPFITSTLQQEAGRRRNFTTKRTMSVAQQLYEGIDLEGETEGLITYMRTDSVRVAEEAVAAARDHIASEYGAAFVPRSPRQYRSRKGAQEAHEAIRPTSLDRSPKKVAQFLSRDQARLYELIWNRFVASQMASARLDVTTVDIGANEGTFRASGAVMKFPGFTVLYSDAEKESADVLPEGLYAGQELILISLTPDQHFTKPPPRYTEATLVKELESKGIGRPSTYSDIVSKIQDRGYVTREKRQLTATDLGMTVNRLLVNSFPDILDVGFTARMEDNLDRIESGDEDWVRVIDEFYVPFEKSLAEASGRRAELKDSLQEETGEQCEKCGRPMVVKWGRNGRFVACSGYPECTNSRSLDVEEENVPEEEARCEKCGDNMVVRSGRYGKFLACSNYPECKNTKPLKADVEGITTQEKCDKCGADMTVRSGRYGPFLACSNYPKCKNAKPIPTGVSCPVEGCDGQIVQRMSKNRRLFYGCSRYPSCKFTSWDKPVAEQCPSCGSPYMIEKASKKKGDFLQCPKCKEETPSRD